MESPLTYPASPRQEDVVDSFHGQSIADPYRWLEDTNSSDTRLWIEAQNEVTNAHLAACLSRDNFRHRLTQLWNSPRRGAPWRAGATWFQFRNDGLQNHAVLWSAQARGKTGSDRTTPPGPDAYVPLLDANTMSETGSVSITQVAASPDGRFLAYALSDSGSDWTTWQIRSTKSREDLPDRVPWSKFSAAAWLPDSSGFFYAGYDAPNEGDPLLSASRDQSVRFHRLGDGEGEDRIVYARADLPNSTFGAETTPDGDWLVISIWDGSAPVNFVYLLDLKDESIRPLLDQGDAEYTFLGTSTGRLYFLTDQKAPRSRIIAIDPKQAESGEEIVAEGEDRILSARMIGTERASGDGWIVVETLHHACSRLEVYDRDGSRVREINLPPLATVTTHAGGTEDEYFHFAAATFTAPGQIFSHHLPTGTTSTIFTALIPDLENADGSGGDPALVAEQIFVDSGDARIPVFLIRRGDTVPNGNVPTLLYGYGGFDVSITPSYNAFWQAWAERGGLVTIACLRGGGEYGRAWHDGGRLHNKQQVFDDAIAVAEHLTAGSQPWTGPQHLGVLGRSNGGLLVGALLTQRPDLFGACIPEVGVLDMLRYHLFTIGWAWISDYGSSEDPELFTTLLRYSPLHNVKSDACYPPTLLTTGDHDDRVVPGHSFKFAATLQRAQNCANPILIRVDTAAGHGAGKPTHQIIAERADVLAFLARHLKLD